MSYLLEILGRGLLAELSAAFRGVLHDDGHDTTRELEARVAGEPHAGGHHTRLAIRLLTERRFTAARERFAEALRLNDNDQTSRLGLACALDELGRTREAIDELKKARPSADLDDGAVSFAIGFCHEKLGDTRAASEAYEACLQINPQLGNAHERLAAIALKTDDVAKAVTHYEQLCWGEPGDLAANLTLANLYLRAGAHDDAIRRFRFAVTLEPDNWEVQDGLISAYVAGHRYHDAIEILQDRLEAAIEGADSAAQYVRLGDLYTKVGNRQRALEAYERATELSPDSLEGAIKVGTAHLRAGRYEESGRAFSRAIEINDRIVAAQVGLGVGQLAAGKRDEALASFEAASEIEPNGTLLFAEMARLQLKVSAAEQTRRYLSPAEVATNPSGPQHQDVEAAVRRQIEQLRALLVTRSGHADLHYRLGVLYRHAGDLDEAIISFRRAVSINPQYFKALIKLGLALRDRGDTESAVCTLKRALAIDSESVELHYQLGLIFADRGEFEQALARFEYAVSRRPNRQDFLANLALALSNMGLLDRADAGWNALCELTGVSGKDASEPQIARTDPPSRMRATER